MINIRKLVSSLFFVTKVSSFLVNYKKSEKKYHFTAIYHGIYYLLAECEMQLNSIS